MGEVVRIGSMIILNLSRLWKVAFFINDSLLAAVLVVKHFVHKMLRPPRRLRGDYNIHEKIVCYDVFLGSL